MRESLYDFCTREGRQELLDQWAADKNLPITPAVISHGSKRKVWWQCEKGHCWRAAVHTRTGSGTGCPVCAGKVPLAGETDLATRCSNLARQWHPTRNGALSPKQVLPGSHRIVWWICEKGHEWRASIKSRVAGCGCPVCANREIHPAENDLASQYPQLAAQWHPTKNGLLTPDQIPPGTTRRVWWICKKGHQWQSSVASRVSGCGCPVCAGRQVAAGENDLASQFPAIAAQWHSEKNGNLTPRQVTPSSNRKVWWRCEKGHDYQATVGARTMRGSGCPYLELATGLRRGELLGLKWEDLDLERGDLRVKRQVSRINGEVVEAPLKTKNAYRTLPLAEDTVSVLKEQRKKVGSSPWVFPSPNGGPISPDSVLHMLHRVLKRAGLPKVRFHDLRHTFATLALQNGVDIKTVSGMLGHFSAGFTLDTYAHVTSAAQRQAAQTMGNVLSCSL